MTICEFLHCTFSELQQKCPSLMDQLLILKYIEEKNSRESRVYSQASRGRQSSSRNVPTPARPNKPAKRRP